MKSLQWVAIAWFLIFPLVPVHGHGSVVSPMSRVLRVRNSNPERPNFALAQNAVAMDGKSSYYTWNQISQNIPQAVQAGLPSGFDYSPWVPDGHLASGGRFAGNVSGLLYAGLDQVSSDWPTTPVTAGETINVDFNATAVHEPSVWDVWMTTPDWTPDTALSWDQMEFLGRPQPTLQGQHYDFDLEIPSDRSGHHVMWVAWQRNDPVGEVFFSTSDLLIEPAASIDGDYNADGVIDAADYTVWRDHLNGSETLPNDPTPESVTAEDYDVWESNYSESVSSGIAVPEPGALTVLMTMLAVAAGVRRQSRQAAEGFTIH